MFNQVKAATVPAVRRGRIDVLDALRGFSLLAIVLLHTIEHFDYYSQPAFNPVWLNSIDPYVWKTTVFMFSGKGSSIFALLF